MVASHLKQNQNAALAAFLYGGKPKPISNMPVTLLCGLLRFGVGQAWFKAYCGAVRGVAHLLAF